MCGVLVVTHSPSDPVELRKRMLVLSSKLRHRGPDWSGIHVQTIKQDNSTTILCHERLAIVDPTSGSQPIVNEEGNLVLSVNGEIYNHVELKKTYFPGKHFKTHGDCEVILYLYEKFGDEFINKLDGQFSFVISDEKTGKFIAARDHMGKTSFYVGYAPDGSIMFSSEMKALMEDCTRVEEFPPGCYFSSEKNEFLRWYNPPWWDEHIPNTPLDLKLLRETFEAAVIKRLMTDVPYGVLLSGGLDSSLVASIVTRHAAKHAGTDGAAKVHSFSVGLENSPDLKAAKMVSEFLGTIHHEIVFSVQEGIDAIPDVIRHIETYDTTTVRASTPMFLLSRKIKAMGIKMVLSGEGSDEVFGGYLYFHKAPNKQEFHVETCHKLKALSKYDCLRANKSTMAWGLEVREPFLDKNFLNVAMAIDPQEKMIVASQGRIEKYILRKAFDTPEKPYLPKEVLWRQKEQFSDGVGFSWIDSLKAHVDNEVSDQMMKTAKFRFPYSTPQTKEAYYYRSIFTKHFPLQSAAETVPGGPSVACSTPAAIAWDASFKNNTDPSGRAVTGVHANALPSKRPLDENGATSQSPLKAQKH